MTEAQQLKTQLVCILALSRDVEAKLEAGMPAYWEALDAMQDAIRCVWPLLDTYAADLAVELR